MSENDGRFWANRVKGYNGKQRAYVTGADLMEAAGRYFDWAHDNPLEEEKLFAYQGVVTSATSSKMRAFTIGGLCTFIGITHESWRRYRQIDELKDAVETIELIIYTQKFEGAAADLLNAPLIKAELGIADKQDITEVTTKRIEKIRRPIVDPAAVTPPAEDAPQ